MRKELVFLFDTFFKQITELGSMTIIGILVLITALFDIKLFLRLFISMIVVTLISYIIKSLFFKDRPKKQKVTNAIEKIDASTFPSVHAARITILTFFMYLAIIDWYGKAFVFLIGLIVAYSRVYLKKHYISDVIGGVILGILASSIVNYLL